MHIAFNTAAITLIGAHFALFGTQTASEIINQASITGLLLPVLATGFVIAGAWFSTIRP